MEWCVVIGIAGRIIVMKISSGRLLLVNSYSTSLRSLLREPQEKKYAEILIPIPMANGPMVVLDLLLHYAIQGDSRYIIYVHSKVSKALLIIIIMFAMQVYAVLSMQ